MRWRGRCRGPCRASACRDATSKILAQIAPVAGYTPGRPMDRLTGLYRMYGPIIYARCMRLLGDRAAAEDATQETFIRVHRHLHKAPDEALGWIYRIATNYCLNEIRNRK